MKKFLICAIALSLILLGLAIKRDRAVDEPIVTLNHSSPTAEAGHKLADPILQAGADAPLDGSIPSDAISDPDFDITKELSTEGLSESGSSAALDQHSPQSVSQATERLIVLLGRWAERDARAAATWATEFPEGPIRDNLLEQVAIAWVNADSSEAVVWLLSLPGGESRQTAMTAAAHEAVRVDPITALSLASELTAGPDRDAILEHAVSQWAHQDFAAASDWVEMISDTDLRQQLLAAVAIAASTEDAPGAARLIANAIPPGETQTRAAVSITQRWAQSSPTDAAAWISQFPEIPARDAAVENLVALWTQADSQATANWVNSLPDGSLRLAAINAFTNSVVQ